MRYLLLGVLLLSQVLCAAPRQLDDYRWDQVDRIVAIGDVHGDYASYLGVLQSAGVVDARGRWMAGETHLVQTGDIPDRGPDTRRIIAHMAGLAKEAAQRGGRVHNLMGNHEAMNVYGDLRYAVAGEFQAYADARSAARRDRYFSAAMKELKARDPLGHAALPADYREQWDSEHPPGWVEHRSAWDPRWNPKGEMFRWAMQTKVAIQLNELIFVHGGISSAYCGNSLESLTRMAHAALRRSDQNALGILEDEDGPLWYRGLAGVAPAAATETVDAILKQHGARHIVIGHTTTGGVIWPRLDGRVVMIDTGMSAVYGGHIGWLEATAGGLVAGYRDGRLPLPMTDGLRLEYLDAVIALNPDNDALRKRRDALQQGQLDGAADAAGVTCDTSR
ncbi:MAG TPA: metallophosphoesterase [Xanthomonadales bacterium]|nr:metallophosphoesterase [Xanthomonadales bacterium]